MQRLAAKAFIAFGELVNASDPNKIMLLALRQVSDSLLTSATTNYLIVEANTFTVDVYRIENPMGYEMRVSAIAYPDDRPMKEITP